MPRRRRTFTRRTPLHVAADARAADLARALGRALRDARVRRGLRQIDVGALSALSDSTISELERGLGHDVSLLAWTRAARAAGTDLRAYLEAASAASSPRDAVHLRNQELVIKVAAQGGWRARPEASIDRDPARSRSADVLLKRERGAFIEHLFVDIWDWFDDVGSSLRSFERSLARVETYAIATVPPSAAGDALRVSGLWVVRATTRNRQLLAAHRHLFRARFPGNGGRSLKALTDPSIPPPQESAWLWVSVSGDRLFRARL
jgi:transcriptional regulator with XRE-family HTH domain